MLPRKIQFLQGVTLLLVLCLTSDFVTAGSLRSKILKNQKTKENQSIDCLSCDSVRSCAFRQYELEKCEQGSCMTIYNNRGLVQQRGCEAANEENVEQMNYCAQNAEKCISCDEAECNSDEISKKNSNIKAKAAAEVDAPHKCYQCDNNDDCEEGGDVIECKSPDNGVLCYMQFGEGVSVVAMGCMDDFDSELEIIDLIKQKLLYVCEGELCNGFEFIPQPNVCASCNSESGENCALDPEKVLATINCNILPYTQCYEHVDSETNGVTRRGCANSLDGDSFWDCLTAKPGDKCRLCHGEGCNKQIVPTNRPKCQRCDSSKNARCEDAPNSLGVCPIYNKEEKCVAVYEGGETKRGCSGEIKCDANNRACQICSGDGCNTANVRRRAEEIYGIFQDLPLNCNTCKGEQCQNGLRNPRKCEGDPNQDCLSVFDESGKVISRGCELEVLAVHAAHCDKHPELCFNCKSNGCNTVADATQYQECLFCDAAINADCLFRPDLVTRKRKCVEGCVSSLYPRKSNPLIHDFVRTCFEDIEDDDRADCKAENNCVKCQNNDCNTDILPKEGRLSCLHCDGPNCNQPVTKACTGYSTEDQCYIYFSDQNFSALKMGCKSELTNDQIEDHIKQYFLCDGDDCNNYENLPQANLCFVCDSSVNENCAVDPSKITALARCQTYPYTECSSWINEHNHTIRGCHYDAPTDVFKKCISGDPSTNCRLCTESRCNNGIFPSRRRQCHRCNSNDDPDCDANPKTTQACPLYQADDACVTKYLNGVTQRGCRSEFSCDGVDSRNCQVCSKNNCNTVVLSEQSIGDPGLFQGLPLNCYHCGGADECATGNGILRKCEGNNLQTCRTAFDVDGKVVQRGCSDLVDEACDATSGNNCYDCKSNGCNTVVKESDYVDCLYCDARESDKCIFEVDSVKRMRKCHKGCMTALYPRTDDEDAVYELIRTCLDDKDEDDRETCLEGKDAKCKPCNGEACNKDDLGERKSCYHCNGDDCQAPKSQTCRAVMDHDQCFIEYDETGTPVQMGCKSNYDPKDVMTLLYNKRIWLCDDDNCNDIESVPAAQRCVICSSRTDENCAIKPDALIVDTNCNRQPYTQCYMKTTPEGFTERGCLSSIEGVEFTDCLWNKNSTACTSCSGNNCNTMVFPAERLSCHHCDAGSSEICESAPASPQICSIYNPNEKCITKVDENGLTLRGCSSKVNCDVSDSSNCQICDSSDCNTSNLKRKSDAKPGMWQDLPISCWACSGVDGCAGTPEATKCQENEYCMTVFNENGRVEERGCSDAVEDKFASYCDANSVNCFNCNSNDCNSANSLNDYVDCVYCDVETNPNCVFDPAAVKNRRKCNGGCMTALYPKANSTAVFSLTRNCLDDKDAADREACRKGDHQMCAACDDKAGCNTVSLPDKRWSCFSCQNEEDCEENLDVQPCKYYKEQEQCFMMFNDLSSVVRAGCASDLEDIFLTDNIDRLFLCNDEANCNSWENIPKPQRCLQCDSSDDADCAADPENIPAVTTCSTLPNTQCATLTLSNGATQRGCVSTLSKIQRLDCLSGNSANCTTCAGDGCNKAIFPADRRRCHRCNTKDDPLCESTPSASAVCPVYNPDEFCATKIVSDHTYRGCSSDFTCDASDANYCRMCRDTDNCNTIDLMSLNIGYPGKWQGLPLNCYHCEGEECAASNGLVRKCEGDKLQTCGTVFDLNGKVVQRACSANIFNETSAYAQHCIDHPDLCKLCKSNGCNTAKSLDDYVDCVFCDGTEKADCVRNVAGVSRRRACHKKCMVGLYPRTDEQNPAFEISRSCLDDLDEDEREACEAGKLKNCKACEGAACNTVALPDVPRLMCHHCNGETDCKNPKSEECLAYREHDQCFALFEGKNVIRLGCSSDFDTVDLKAQRRHLFQCDSENCNQEANFPKPTGCVVCDSSENPLCAIKPDSSIIAAGCDDLPWTNCYTAIDEAGATLRGCLSDVSDELFDECVKDEKGNCVLCSENNCNKQIFPENRRSCYRCDSAVDAACEYNAQTFNSVCPIYEETDHCVTKVEGKRTMRGCGTDFTCDPNDRKTCRICTSDDCNSVNLLAADIGEPGKWQELPLNCYHCEGEDCINGNILVNTCENNNLQTCMTVFGVDGKLAKLGCSDAVEESHLEYCEEHSDKCFACKSNACNNAKSADEFKDCYFCDSNDGRGCSVDFDATKSRSRKCKGGCVVALYPRSAEEDPAYDLTRSCIDDLEEDDRVKCMKGELEFCKACEGENCNTMTVPEERHECYQCDGGDACEDPVPLACNSYHPNDQCYTLYDEKNNIALMGCRSDYDSNVIVALIKQKQLILCDGKNCNKPENVQAKTCLACDSAEDPRCATNPNLLDTFVRCSNFPYTDCGTIINEDGHTVRGCVSAFEADKFYGCITNSDGLCETCAKDACNSIDVFPANRLRCHQCDSSSNEKCTSMPDSNRVCPIYDPNDACVSDLRNGDTTFRGCSSSMKCYNENDKRNCRTCKTSGCNTVDLVKIGADGEPGKWQDVPINCIICDDEEDCKSGIRYRKCEENPYQNCMTVFNVAGAVIKKGCSDAVEAANKQWCDSNAENCPRCNSNGCNVATLLDDYVNCWACDTDVSGTCVNNLNEITKTRKCYKHCVTAMYPKYEEENPSYDLTRSCLDDLELDDREACAAGKKEYCETCTGDNCNTVAIPVKRLSCQMCKGEDCQLPVVADCPQYRENDQCYILFNEQYEIAEMGCRSKFSNADADFYFKQKRLFLCENDNCNDVDALPAAQQCKICSSRTDLECATNPSVLDTTVNCNKPPFTDCYTLWRKDGSTERGCAWNLYDEELLDCLNSENSTVCQTCKGDNCNAEVFPANRAACHICDSSFDPACEARPDSVSICPKYDPDDTCVTAWRNGVTERGCASSLRCDGSKRVCSKCSGEGCNTINLAKRQDDNFGKWQDLPLRCYVCRGDDCNDLSKADVATCQDNNEQDCVVVFDEIGKVVARDCADKIDETHGDWCDAHEDLCLNCKSNECNVAVALNEFEDCVYCDAHKDLSCLWQPLSNAHGTRKCRGGCMTALYASDSGADSAFDLIRTCLSDKDLSDQTSCSNGRDANCKACTGASCNVGDVVEDRKTCYYCVNGDCEEPVSMKCPLYKKGDQCYIWFDNTNSIHEMGCVSSFRSQTIESLIRSKRVWVCNEGDNCNSLEKIPASQKCAVCDSKSDVLCAINAKSVSTYKECNMLPNTGCFSKLNRDGSTARGCQTDLDDDSFVDCVLGKDQLCEPCSGDSCNREIFPVDRQQCHTCTSEDDADCESFPTRMQPCPVVSDRESCKTALSGNETVRGCSSEILCDANDRLTCRQCFGTECNSIDLRNLVDDGYHGAFQDLPLSCHTCEGEHCQFSLGPTVECENYLWQDCMTVFHANGTVKRRGCSDAVEDYENLYCRKHPELCFSCKSNECNFAWELEEYVDCTFCNSSTSTDCVIRPSASSLPHRKCRKECMVTMIKDDEIIRSCLDDIETFNQIDCRDEANANSKMCASCENGNCNNFVYPRDRLQCHVCTGADCRNSVGEYCLKYDKNDFCFAKFEKGQVERMGCGSNVDKAEIDEWTAQKKLFTCQGEDCNALIKLPKGGQCLACNSKDNINCAQNPTAVTTYETCDAPSSECATKIEDGNTIRGCFSKLDQAEQAQCVGAGTCAVCTGDRCNIEIFPANRRKCHICSSCSGEPNNLLVCPHYQKGDRCVSKRVDGITSRGCESDFTCDPKNENDCQICETDGCNTIQFSSGALSRSSASFLLTMMLAFISIRLFNAPW